MLASSPALTLFLFLPGPHGFASRIAAWPVGSGSVGTPAVGVVALVFVVTATGLTLVVAYARRRAQATRKLQAANPESPWMWRADWAQGRCNSRTKASMIQAWTSAILWNLVSAPTLFLASKGVHQQPLAALGFIFPLAGVAMLLWAIRETLAWFEFGATWFEMASSPVVIGREFRGSIHARFPHGTAHGIRLKLSCINQITTGSGKSETVTDRILWRDEKNVSAAELYPGPVGTMIPVSFRIPWNALQTDVQNPRNSILWLLEADGDVPGVDYKDIFELPVFRTSETPAHPETEPVEVNTQYGPPARPTVVVTPTAAGAEFYFPAGRNRSFAGAVSAFFMLWTGVLALMIYLHTPILFPAVFGAFDLLLLFGAAQLWLGTSRVIVDSARIRVQMGWLGKGKWREYPKAQILDIQAVIGAQQGGAPGTPFYDIRLLQTEHPNVTMGRMLRDKEEAEWVVSQMKRALGLRMAAAAGVN